MSIHWRGLGEELHRRIWKALQVVFRGDLLDQRMVVAVYLKRKREMS
jgi:hypothetical protein